jgi:Domain of unknown function (DUF1844)
MGKEPEESGFRVTDKRHFAEDGKPRDDGPVRDSKETAPEAAAPLGDSAGEEPRIDFPSYVLSYYTQGLVLLGEVPNPYTNKKEEDLQASRHTIDVLAMLQEKTKGNLTKEEDQLLDSVLYELRMKFMAKTNRIKL